MKPDNSCKSSRLFLTVMSTCAMTHYLCDQIWPTAGVSYVCPAEITSITFYSNTDWVWPVSAAPDFRLYQSSWVYHCCHNDLFDCSSQVDAYFKKERDRVIITGNKSKIKSIKNTVFFTPRRIKYFRVITQARVLLFLSCTKTLYNTTNTILKGILACFCSTIYSFVPDWFTVQSSK